MRFLMFAAVAFAVAFQFSGSIASEQQPELRIYDVTDLVTNVPDYPSVTVNAPTPCFGGGQNAGTPTCASVAEMIKVRVRPQSWDPVSGVSIEERGGMLIIMQTAEIHQEITALFEKFRDQTKSQIVVKGLLVPSATIPRETFYNAELLAKLLGPKGAAGALAAPRIVCCNCQRTSVLSFREHGHIGDYEISGDMLDPVILQLKEGWIFDVRPILSYDRRLISVELRCALTSGANMAETRKITLAPPLAARNVKGEKTPLASALEVDTPSLQHGSVHSTVRIPDGKWVLAGTIPNPDAEAKEKHLLLLVSAESLNKNIVGKPYVAGEDLGARKDGGAVAPKAVRPKPPKDPGPAELRIFDIRDMTTNMTDFPAPRETSNREKTAAPAAVDPFAGAPIANALQDTDIAAMIKDKALADYFAEPEMTIDVSNGKLVVYNRAAVHEKIAALLDEWREMLLPQVVIRSHLVAANEIPDATYFDEAAVDAVLKKDGNETRADYRCVCANKQMTYAKNGREFSYIHDYDVSGSGYDPVVKNAFDGDMFEVRPIAVTNRTAIQLDLCFSLASDVKRTTRTLGAASSSGATATKDLTAEGQTGGLSGSSLPLMHTSYVAGCELDSVAMNKRALNTQIVIPKNKWVLAGVMANSNPKGPKHLLLFVTAEVIENAK